MNMIKSTKSTNLFVVPALPFLKVGLLLMSLIFVSAQNVQADDEKQISYPVAIPIERPAATAVAAPEYKAPEPVIRSIEEASSVPASTASKNTVSKKKKSKKTAATEKVGDEEAAQDEPKKSASSKKNKTAPTKTTKAKATKAAKSKNAAAEKTVPAEIPLRKSTTAKIAGRSVFTQSEPRVNTDAEKKSAENQTYAQTRFAKPINDLMPNADPALVELDEITDTDLAENPADLLPDDEQEAASETVKPDATVSIMPVVPAIKPLTPVVPPPLLPANKSPAPISKTEPLSAISEHEAFVAEFQRYVETRIVPMVPGAALAIIADGKVKVLEGYGVKKSGGRDLVNTDTVFRLASVSKTIASTAASLLVHDGKITWDTPVTSVLPEVEFSNARYGNALTLRDIMSQATGLPTHTFTNLIEENIPYEEAVKRLRYINFVCPPGKCYAYQNVTYSLISNIILKKTHETYDQYVKEKLFVPLGMNSASFGLDGLKASNNFALPNVMTARGRWYTTDIEENYYHIYPAAGANASIRDMSRWVLAQIGHNPEVLSPSTLSEIHAKVTINTPAQSHYGAREGVTDTHYGLGWRVFDYRGDKNFVHHGGWVKGFRSEVVFSPELQIGMVFLTNSETRLARDIIFKFLDSYEDDKQGVKKVASVMPKKKSVQ